MSSATGGYGSTMLIAGILEVLFWILFAFVLLGAIIGLAAFLGLRKLWHFVADAFEADGRTGPGNPPLSRRSTTRSDPHDATRST